MFVNTILKTGTALKWKNFIFIRYSKVQSQFVFVVKPMSLDLSSQTIFLMKYMYTSKFKIILNSPRKSKLLGCTIS